MADQISISKTLGIRDCGFDEYWLQDQIAANPSIIGLGELEAVRLERQQSSGGRLDILLNNPDGDSMYEVEVMLGATDEAHIIRTIEYWDLERRRWPKRTHAAVLVAEKMNRRFFNVVQLLSHTIPIIAIQANIIEADSTRVLHFTKILDAYQEPELEDPAPAETIGEDFWQEKAPWTLAHAKTLQEILSRVLGEMKLGFSKNRIRLRHNGEIYFSLAKWSGGRSSFWAWLKKTLIPAATAMLDEKRIPYDSKPYDSEWQSIRLRVDQSFIQQEVEVFQTIAESVKQSWQSINEN